VAAGIAFGISWLIKPYLLLMVVPLVVRREWKVVRTAAATMCIGLLLPMLLEGPRAWWELLREWVEAMVHHTQVMESPDRIGALLGELVGKPPSTLLDVALIGLVGAGLAWLAWHNVRIADRSRPYNMDRAFELWLAAAVVPNLVITDQQHFMFSLPLILLTLAWMFTKRERAVLVLFLLALALYGTRSTDLWGSDLENRLVGWGVLGMGNILLMGTSCLVWRRWRKPVEVPKPTA
jgi:hypothetical protein